MRIPWTIVFLLAGVLWADQAADRRAIEGVIERLNDRDQRPSLFVEGADARAELRRLDRAGCLAEPRIWSEVPAPRFTRPTVQFIAPDVALADVEYMEYLRMAFVRTPIVVVLKREAGEWRIATLRVVGDCPGALRIVPAGR
jgi:hypothetical protein